jgi:hypothetical protein
MFNKELKERFLSGYIDNTARMYRYALTKAESMEIQLNKDIYDFTSEERDMLLYSYSNRSLDTVNVMKSSLSRYVAFCVAEGYVKDKINYFETIGGKDLDKYIDKSALESKYITIEQLLDMSNVCINLQDLLPFLLAFHGILGSAASEIINLKTDSLKDGNVILEDRLVKIDERVYDLIEKAIEDEIYYVGNGDTDARATSRVINQTEYVVRPAGETKFGTLIYSSLLQRVGRVKEYYGNPYLTLKNVWFSGMLHDLREFQNKDGELTKEHWASVCKKFGYGEDNVFQLKQKIGKFI